MEKFKEHLTMSRLISDLMTAQSIGLIETRTVAELLWGYEDPLLKDLKVVIHTLDDMFGLFYKVTIAVVTSLKSILQFLDSVFRMDGRDDVVLLFCDSDALTLAKTRQPVRTELFNIIIALIKVQ